MNYEASTQHLFYFIKWHIFDKKYPKHQWKIRVDKLLWEVSIEELHNDLMTKPPTELAEVYNKDRKCLISDTVYVL